jgi:hypothetical protein
MPINEEMLRLAERGLDEGRAILVVESLYPVQSVKRVMGNNVGLLTTGRPTGRVPLDAICPS